MRRLLLVSLLAGCGLAETAPFDWLPVATDTPVFRRPPAIQLDERGTVATWTFARPAPATLEVQGEGGETLRYHAPPEERVELPFPRPGQRVSYRVVAGDTATPWQTFRLPDVPLTFAVLGDSRPDSGVEQPPVFHQLMKTIAQEAELAVETGDMVQLTPKAVRPITQGWVEDAYDHLLAAANPVMARMPFLPVLGNHDAPWSDKAEAGFQAAFVLPRTGRAERYYSYDLAGVHFAVLDSEENFLFKKANLSEHQFAWLERDLANRSTERAFVFLHRPLFGGSHSDDFGNGNPAQRDRLHAMFRRHRVTAVIAGHDHRYDYRLVDGIPYVITGGAGSPIRSRDGEQGIPPAWLAHHWVKISVTPSGVTGDAIGVDGSNLHHWQVR